MKKHDFILNIEREQKVYFSQVVLPLMDAQLSIFDKLKKVYEEIYDFKNDLANKIPGIPRTKDYEGLSTLEKVGKLAADSFRPSAGGVKSLPSRVGNAFIGGDGRPVRVDLGEAPFKKGGKVTPKRTSASKRGDGIAVKGHTKGKFR